jgi:hypothetical protein
MEQEFDRERMAERAADLAVQGVYIGTSSWKHPGWVRQLYSSQRYEYRNKFAMTRFNRDCLREYSEVFKTVCDDAADCLRYLVATKPRTVVERKLRGL